MKALVKSSEAFHIAVTNGMPKLVVLAAPQKHTAIICSRGILRIVRARRSMRGSHRATLDSASSGFIQSAKKAGGRAEKKHIAV